MTLYARADTAYNGARPGRSRRESSLGRASRDERVYRFFGHANRVQDAHVFQRPARAHLVDGRRADPQPVRDLADPQHSAFLEVPGK
jgi:hypothetical protein